MTPADVKPFNPYAVTSLPEETQGPMMSDHERVDGFTLVANTMACVAFAGSAYAVAYFLYSIVPTTSLGFHPAMIPVALIALIPGAIAGLFGSLFVVPPAYFLCVTLRAYKFEWTGSEILQFAAVCGAITGGSVQFLISTLIDEYYWLAIPAAMIGFVVSAACSKSLAKRADLYHAAKVPAFD